MHASLVMLKSNHNFDVENVVAMPILVDGVEVRPG
jgi:hypothetical protein